jgi:hypothetical protein
MKGHMRKGTPVGEVYFDNNAPGVYRENDFSLPQRSLFMTGVPVFLGMNPRLKPSDKKRSAGEPQLIIDHKKDDPPMLTLWSHFEKHFERPAQDSYLAYAVRGFFQNGGRRCYVAPLKDLSEESLQQGLNRVAALNMVDLVCVPELATLGEKAFELQQLVVKHCEDTQGPTETDHGTLLQTGDRFAILDPPQGAGPDEVWRQWWEINGHNGAIYYPWVRVHGFEHGTTVLVPPCGHLAGVYARTDASRGVHKAPANEVLEGVLDLERPITNTQQDYLNPRRVNCLRSFPGRGIRVWGARTLSGQPDWMYVNVRRLFLTAVRWMNWQMMDVVFEPNDARLWARIERELTTYFIEQYRAGALKGRTPQEAFYVKCNAETNPPEMRDKNRVVTEIGLAPTTPYEFVVVRFIHGASGVSIEGPAVAAPIS